MRISYQDYHDSERKQGGGEKTEIKIPTSPQFKLICVRGRERGRERVSADLLFNFPELCISEHRQQASQGQGAFSVVMQPHLKR